MKTQIALSTYRILLAGIIMFAILWPTFGKADDLTNRTFRSVLFGRDLTVSAQDLHDLTDQKLDGRFGRELLPAAEDSQGNWGEVTNGLQMSIRFYQSNWTNGQPVSAVILWRNVSTTPQSFSYIWGVEKYYFDLVVRLDGTTLKPLVLRIDPNYRPEAVSGPGPMTVQPGEQIRVEQKLDKIFDLEKPGAYEINAERRGVRSGVAKFWIYPKN